MFLARWVVGARLAAAWLAGINRMHWLTFGFWNALGGITGAATVGLLAYVLGPAAEHVFKTVGVAGVFVAGALAVTYVVWRLTRARSARAVHRGTEPSA